MRRTVVLALLAFALGTTTALAIALLPAFVDVSAPHAPQTCSLFSRHGRPWFNTEIRMPLYRQNAWSELPRRDGTVEEVLAHARDDLAPRVVIANRRMSDRPPRWGTLAGDDAPPGQHGFDHGFGWPFTCLWYRDVARSDGTLRMEGCRALFQSPPSRTFDDPALPAWPIYPALAANITLFTLFWTAALTGPPKLRRHLRLRRGHCPDCGYDLAGTYSSPCPECGRT